MRRGPIIVSLVLIIFILGCIGKDDPPIDTDNDSIPDIKDPDADNDCIPDDWELKNGLDPLDPDDKHLDLDGDGVDNKNEYDTSTDPGDPESFSLQMKENISLYGVPLYLNASFLFGALNETDFDDDGIPDWLEKALLMDPVDPENAWEDWDDDGISNKAELMDANTDPF